MKVLIERDDLKPVVAEVVTEVMERFSNDDRISYTEPEAAELIGVKRHVLRDERLKGRVRHGKVGNKIVYTRRQLLEFVEGREE
ncbi:MAG: helix-turn-helix domain-containing protein [Planctomycetaceae bacterium]|jgi:hypothetical protein|nr:helix-turn-helix domain-containing protein [Planctomycetaceae bacterium]MBT6485387.1 helix-turn-helix domain-containing protein [Planctomycetaceae bacterium]